MNISAPGLLGIGFERPPVVGVSPGNIEIKFRGCVLIEVFCLPFEVAAAQCRDDVSSNPMPERKICVLIKPDFISFHHRGYTG
jgi:hypothetical protein